MAKINFPSLLFILSIQGLGAQTAVSPPSNSQDYSPPPGATLGVLTLNLHTCQEKDPRKKLDRVADFIALYHLDVVCFQECAQHEEGVLGATPMAPFQGETPLAVDNEEYPGNSAWLVQKRLKEVHGLDYFFVWTWAHTGFGVYQEGSAVLARHKITSRGEALVSTEEEKSSPSRRDILWADMEISGFGPLRMVSTHLGWGGDQMTQIRNLESALGKQNPIPTLVAGDFNMEPSFPGYKVLKEEFKFRDDFIASPDRGRQASTMDSRRIDYLWSLPGFPLAPLKAWTVFRPQQTGSLAPVSDHSGLVVWYGNSSNISP